MPPKLVSAGDGKTVNVIGNEITILLCGQDTGGALAVMELKDQPQEGPPPHIHHREDETFHVLEGTYEFMCGDDTFSAGVGATIFAPRGVPHAYRQVGSTPGRLLVSITPAGFEGFFEEVGILSAAEQEIPRVIAIGEKYGLEFLPPPN
jgi:mannose-6-phosphate isomerase-like protein (cupin superfamily)